MSKHVISIIIIVIQLVTIEHAQTDTKSSATRDIFSRKQEEGESVDSYIDKMQKNAVIYRSRAHLLCMTMMVRAHQ